MHGFVPLGADQTPVHPAIIWPDARPVQQVAALAAARGDRITSTLPGPPAAGYAAASALWLKEHQPDVLEKMAVWCLPKDALRMMMTGEVCTEPSDAASSWLFDIATGTWADDVAAFCGLSPEQMPPVVPSAAVAGELTATAAAALDLPAGVPVVAGSADLPAQGLGHGIVDASTLLITVGTGGQLFVPTHDPQPDPDDRYYLLNHSLKDAWYIQAAILSGGLSLRWLRDLLGDDVDYADLSTLAAGVPAGAEGLIFLPYLAGERSPLMDPDASGAFLGLRLNHTRAHLARAIMEGVAFALRDCLSILPQQAERFLLSGGAVASPVWSQILADVLEHPLHLATDNAPHGCLGAAVLAGLGVGAFSDVHEANQHLKADHDVITPQSVPVYTTRFEQYRRLYPMLRAEMHLLRY
jgi:xylulokinase